MLKCFSIAAFVTVTTLLAVALFSSLIFTGLSTAEPQDSKRMRGEAIAQKICTNCHAIHGDDHLYQGKIVPSFAKIAMTPHFTLVNLRRVIARPLHPMPAQKLTDADINDLAVFITSLRKVTE